MLWATHSNLPFINRMWELIDSPSLRISTTDPKINRKIVFLGRFPIGEKGAQKSMDGRLGGQKRAHDTSAEGSVLAGGSLGLASRARGQFNKLNKFN